VLVIDDDPGSRSVLSQFLAKKGFRVEVAADGAEGLALARKLRPLAITLDVVMPGMDGWAVLAALKADPDLADIPVVMLTMVDDRNKGFQLGAADYLVKPVDPGRLTAVLRRHQGEPSARRVLVVDDDPNLRRGLRWPWPPSMKAKADAVRLGMTESEASAEAAAGKAAESEVNRPARMLPQSYPLQRADRRVLMLTGRGCASHLIGRRRDASAAFSVSPRPCPVGAV
jgi:CheY-like chemotaxis protein